jgi:hypothetical protein
MKGSAEERFWHKVDRSAGTEACWPWMGGRNDNGYGISTLTGKIMGAHRRAFELTNGAILTDQVVCHACDNPCCCNPAHLWLGTHKENMHDSVAKGRRKIKNVRGDLGRKHMMIDVSEISPLFFGVPPSTVAEHTGVSYNTVRRIMRGITTKVHYDIFVKLRNFPLQGVTMTPKPRNYTVPFLTLLSPAQHADLQAAAQAEGSSMADVLRAALDTYLCAIGPVTFEVSAATDDGAEEDA